MNLIYRFQMQLPTEIRQMVTQLFAKGMFTCPTNIDQLSSNFPSYFIIELTINWGVQVSSHSNWNCLYFSLQIFPQHTANGNK